MSYCYIYPGPNGANPTYKPDPFGLILDDLHHITAPVVYLALDYLLEHLPPAMHLIIATRYDPPLALARLKARGQLAEFRLADLRFTDEEAATFLNEQLHLDLSASELINLHTRTEGWAAGLRLLAGSLAQRTTPRDRTAFINTLARTDEVAGLRHPPGPVYRYHFSAENFSDKNHKRIRTFITYLSFETVLYYTSNVKFGTLTFR